MKPVAIILFICVVSSYGSKKTVNKNIGIGEKKEYYNEVGYYFNPDDNADMVRPCQVYDLNCIRRFFAEHAHCSVKYGPLPDRVSRTQYDIYLSRINVTASHNNLIASGFNNTRIEEFYINKVTNNVVFAIEVRNLTLFTPSSYWQFFRRGREPIVIESNASILYRSLTITAVIPNIKDMQLDDAEITAYLPDSNPPFSLGAEMMTNPDPEVTQAMTELYADVPTDVQEVLLTESLQYPVAYIQYNICDFGYETTLV